MYFSRAKIEILQSDKKISNIKLINIVDNNMKMANIEIKF